MLSILIDNNGNKYFQFKNVRVSIKHAPGAKDWDGAGRYLQILTYRDSTRSMTYPGPQIPIGPGTLPDDMLLTLFHAMLVLGCGPETLNAMAA